VPVILLGERQSVVIADGAGERGMAFQKIAEGSGTTLPLENALEREAMLNGGVVIPELSLEDGEVGECQPVLGMTIRSSSLITTRESRAHRRLGVRAFNVWSAMSAWDTPVSSWDWRYHAWRGTMPTGIVYWRSVRSPIP
jgi:hypothetical protein